MLFRSRPAVSQADPHDAIVAQLRELAPRIKQDWPETQEPSFSTATPEPIAGSLFETAPSNDNAEALLETTPRKRPGRGILKALLAISIGVAAAMAWRFYGEEAMQKLSYLTPHFSITAPESSATATEPETQEDAMAAQAAAPQAASAQSQPASDAQLKQTVTADDLRPSTSAMDAGTAPAQASPASAALPAETAQLIEAMAGDIAALKQTVEELRTSEQQLRREIVAEREARSKPAPHTAKPVPPRRQSASPQAAIPHNPPAPRPSRAPAAGERRMYPQEPMQRDAYVPPAPAPAPAQPPLQTGGDSAPRPPMPLR
jgi:hypothetical protein